MSFLPLRSVVLRKMEANGGETLVAFSSPAGLVTCQRDSYLKSIKTSFVSQQENRLQGEDARALGGGFLVELADTVLFPEGGGQPPDHGTVMQLLSTNPRINSPNGRSMA